MIIALFRKKIKNHFFKLILAYNKLNIGFKCLYVFIFIITLAQSATKPYLLDNESYYIQTIKWINNYGFVKGLANLHMFFAQNSAWHVLQAGFNFPFISNRLNDINGFVFVVMVFLFIEKLNSKKQTFQSLNLGLTLLCSLFYFQFINAPSPDLIIFLIAPYLFYLFVNKYNNISRDDFKILLFLTVFLCFVKVTIVTLLILPFTLFIKHYKHLKKEIGLYSLISLLCLILFIGKNIIISGYPLYPLKIFKSISLDWKLPDKIIEFYKLGTYLDALNNADVSQLAFYEKLKLWISLPKLDGFLNKIFLFILFVFPYLLFKLKNRTPFIIIYLITALQFILLWHTSPQYRFFFIFIAFLGIQIFSFIIKKRQHKIILVVFATVIGAVPIFVPINLNAYTDNKFAMKLNTFKLENVIHPERKSKTTTEFTKYKIENFEFYSPGVDVFFWATGDGNLPCVNQKQIEYFKTYYKYIPELRTGNLNDGFRSKKIE
nr:hypothetical protein [Tamlana sp. I1]